MAPLLDNRSTTKILDVILNMPPCAYIFSLNKKKAISNPVPSFNKDGLSNLQSIPSPHAHDIRIHLAEASHQARFAHGGMLRQRYAKINPSLSL